jgi:hypothetical protein
VRRATGSFTTTIVRTFLASAKRAVEVAFEEGEDAALDHMYAQGFDSAKP